MNFIYVVWCFILYYMTFKYDRYFVLCSLIFIFIFTEKYFIEFPELEISPIYQKHPHSIKKLNINNPSLI